MNAAKENSIRESVRCGLQKLATGNSFTRADLFGKMGDHTADYTRISTILRRLHAGNLIESTTPIQPGGVKLHAALNAAELSRIASDDFELSRLIWPGRTPPRPTNIAPSTIADALSSTPEPVLAAEKAIESDLVPQSDMNKDAILASVLKMLVALTENVIYLREKVDSLDAVACSHCSNLGAHRD